MPLQLAAFFRGIGDTKTPLHVTLADNVVNAALAKGVVGAWLAELVHIWVLGGAFALRLRGGAWEGVRI